MATVQYTRVQAGAGEDIPTGVVIYQWVLAASDDGVPVSAPQFSGKVAMHVLGTGVTTMQGSLHMPSETEVWGTLHDPASADLVLTVNEIRQILEDCVQVRPLNDATGAATIRLMVTTSARR